MLALYQGDSHTINLKCYRENTNVLEDFTGSEVFLFLVGEDKTPLTYTIEGNVIKFTLASGWNAEAYDIEVIWSKNAGRDVSQHHLNHAVYNYALVEDAFCITENSGEATNLDSGQVVEIVTHVARYGYDGLNSYEIAVMRGLTTLSEKNWVANLSEMNSAVNAAVSNAQSATTAANTAAASANSAVSSIASAVSSSQQAVTAAQSALTSANAAVANANTAAASANAAAGRVEAAVTAANSAKNGADSAAATAQSAAQSATSATTGAEKVNAVLNGTKLTVTDRQGVSKTVETKGADGSDYVLTDADKTEIAGRVDVTGKANVGDCYTKAESDGKYLTEHQSLSGYATESWVEGKNYLTQHQSLVGKQDKLVSGTNIKTINGQSVLGSGDITVSGGGSGTTDYSQLTNKPSIGGKVLNGAVTLSEIGAVSDSDSRLADARTPLAHTHTKEQITDFSHTHSKSEITDFPSSLPASDVSAWAKEATKPSYASSEITDGDSNVGAKLSELSLKVSTIEGQLTGVETLLASI